jgi:hypothetical protein
MIVSWASFKDYFLANIDTQMWWVIENHYDSNNGGQHLDRYNIRIFISGVQYTCLIVIENPVSSDQVDFETNYKPTAIEG